MMANSAALEVGTYASEPSTEQGVFTISLRDAEDALARALEYKGAAKLVAARIASTRKSTLYRHTHALNIGVKSLQFDPETGKFSANLLFMDGEEVLTATPVSGRYEEMVRLPVARQRISTGSVITAEDVDELAYSAARIRKDTVTDPAQLIGQTPTRVISKGRPIRLSELRAPSILKKGAMVQMHYRTAFMTISTTGEAMQDGGLGELIKVRNADSGAIVEARIDSEHEVVVGSASSLPQE